MTTEDDALDATLTADAAGPSETVLSVGTVLADRYEVLEALGAGAMGEVYRVHDRKLDEVVALKRLGTVGSSKAVERFMHEVKLSRRVTHRHVARTFDVGVDGDRPFLTMELLDGETLEDLLERRRNLPEAEAVKITLAMLEGLAAAHEAEVVHRDLKPSNVMITKAGRVVLTDFGIARAMHSPGLTQGPQLLGTPLYMAPEQVRGAPVDHRADIYAFGVMLYEMVTGACPFDGDTPAAVALARLSREPPDPRTRATLSDDFAAVVLQCLAREPDGRFDDVRALQRALRGETKAAPLPPPTTSQQSLAVLPFGYRGEADADYLGEAVAEALVDVLGRIRDLRVVAFAATVAHGAQADPRSVADAVDVAHVVTGTVQRRGARVRVTVRMLDRDGTQAWTERFESTVEDVFALEEEMSQRIAEALRLELGTVVHGKLPPMAVDLYFRARRAFLVDGYDEVSGPLRNLEACIELAPDFGPAYALHAAASARSWFASFIHGPSEHAAEAADDSVRRALERAPDHPDTHLARGILALQRQDLPGAAQALAYAVRIAPTLALAHIYLGMLQMEAGAVQEAEMRIRGAVALDPTLESIGNIYLGRILFWRGEHEAFEATLEVARRLGHGGPLQAQRLRATAWSGNLDHARRAREELARLRLANTEHIAVLIEYVLGTISAEQVVTMADAFLETVDNPRFIAFVQQLLFELHVFRGEHARAIPLLEALVEGGLADIDWLERCPTFEPIRHHPAFAAARREVRARANRILELDLTQTGTWAG